MTMTSTYASDRVLMNRGFLFGVVNAPVNEYEVGVVGPATAQELAGLGESENVLASHTQDDRDRLPKSPDTKRHEKKDESERARVWRKAARHTSARAISNGTSVTTIRSAAETWREQCHRG
jgi:hypothetical protein